MITTFIASLVSLVSLAMLGGQSATESDSLCYEWWEICPTDITISVVAQNGDVISTPVSGGRPALVGEHVSVTWNVNPPNALPPGGWNHVQMAAFCHDSIVFDEWFDWIDPFGVACDEFMLEAGMIATDGRVHMGAEINVDKDCEIDGFVWCQMWPTRSFDIRNPDLNGDGVVDVDDLLMILIAFGQTPGMSDLNGDNVVDIADLLILLEHWTE